MKKRLTLIAILMAALTQFALAGDDWGNFARYESMNDSLRTAGVRPKAVFMGNSITEGWVSQHPDFFILNNFEGRGISGQTSYQNLLRFRDDVIALNPEIVVINCGTNDIAENNHPYNEERSLGNIISMVELARAAGIRPVLTSVLPSSLYYWHPEIDNVTEKVRSLNARIAAYAAENKLPYVDYYPGLVNEDGGLKAEYSEDGVHPNGAGYDVMEACIMEIIKDF